MYCLLAFAIAISAGIVSGQQEEESPCGIVDAKYGTYFVPHKFQCDLYYQCDTDQRSWLKKCQEGLLFDTKTKRCQWPEQTTCNSQACDMLNPYKVATECCDTYLQCQNGKLSVQKCSEGQTFVAANGMCMVGSTCIDHYICNRHANTQPQDQTCYLKPVQDKPCQFYQFHSDGTLAATKQCAAGTAFNEKACRCLSDTVACASSSSPKAYSKEGDDQCRASMMFDFPALKMPVTYTLKTPDGQMMATNYHVKTEGYTGLGTEGQFRSQTPGQVPSMLIYHFAGNMLKGPFGLKFSFKADAPQDNYMFTLLTNGFEREDCAATVEITAKYYSSRRQWEITAMLVGSEEEKPGVNVARLNNFVPAGNGGEYTTVSIIFNKMQKKVEGYAWTRDQSNNRIGSPTYLGESAVGDMIMGNNCGFSIAKGLQGRLAETKFYEACNNIDVLKSEVSA